MTRIPPPPVAYAVPEVMKAIGVGAFNREPIDALLEWLTTFQAHGNVHLEPALANALTSAAPGCASVEAKLVRLTDLLTDILSGKQSFREEEHTFFRIVLNTWVTGLSTRTM